MMRIKVGNKTDTKITRYFCEMEKGENVVKRMESGNEEKGKNCYYNEENGKSKYKRNVTRHD